MKHLGHVDGIQSMYLICCWRTFSINYIYIEVVSLNMENLFFVLFLFSGSLLNSCGCSTAKSKTPQQETFSLPT